MAAASGGRQEPSHLVVGRVNKAHGTKGEVFVWPLTDQPDAVLAEGRSVWLGTVEGELGEAPEALEIHGTRPFKRGLLVSFTGRMDRDTVELMTGRYLLVERVALAAPAEGEWYYHQLVGLAVEDESGGVIGRVRTIYESAPADLLEIEKTNGGDVLIPLSRQIVKRVDIEAGKLVVKPPPGLLDL